jgi:hypothetical protein
MRKTDKVIHVELKEPYEGKCHYYYGSKAAIYGHLPEALIGIKLESLWNVDLDAMPEGYSNRLCTIRMGTLKRKNTQRGGQWINVGTITPEELEKLKRKVVIMPLKKEDKKKSVDDLRQLVDDGTLTGLEVTMEELDKWAERLNNKETRNE